MERQRPGRLRSTQGAPQSSLEIIYEEFRPSFEWTRDSTAHILLLDCSGFKKEDVKVQVDSMGKLTVRGERKVNERRYSIFNQEFQVPTDSDTGKISGKFENGLLYLIMPLKVQEKKEEPHKVMATSVTAQKEEKPIQEQGDAAIGKDSEKKEVKPPQKQEPKQEDAPTGKDSTKIEEKPSQKQDPKKEEAAVGKDSSKKEEKPMSTQKEEPKKGDGVKKEEKPISTQKEEEPKKEDGAKKEEKPISTQKEEEPKEEDGAKKEEKPMSTQKEEPKKEDGAKKDEKPMSTQKEEPKKEDGAKKDEKPIITQKEEPKEGKKEDREEIGIGSKKDEMPTHKKRPKKKDVEGHKISHEERRKDDLGCREIVGRIEKQGEEREAMAMEGKDQEKDFEDGLFDRVLQQINKNKYIIATAALAFSFGVYLSRKLR